MLSKCTNNRSNSWVNMSKISVEFVLGNVGSNDLKQVFVWICSISTQLLTRSVRKNSWRSIHISVIFFWFFFQEKAFYLHLLFLFLVKFSCSVDVFSPGKQKFIRLPFAWMQISWIKSDLSFDWLLSFGHWCPIIIMCSSEVTHANHHNLYPSFWNRLKLW